jgi:F-type H+-transporting ATPase subunit delta
MSSRRQTTQFAHELLQLSLADGRLAPERVQGVLAWVDKHRPSGALALLRAYRRLVAGEIERGRATIEYAGEVAPDIFAQIGAAMSERYHRPIEPMPVARPDLIAGLRVRVGCDIFENTVAGQLAALRPAS